ncbi:DMT family transporter [Tsuneonella sp. HG094]
MQRQDRSGLLIALVGFAMLSVGDAVVKTMVGDWPPTAIAALRYMIGAAGLSAVLLAKEGVAGFRLVSPGLQLVRGLAVAVATAGFFGSLFLMSLAEATTIVFVSPLITGLVAPLVLKERSSGATWIASSAAFIGVLIVLRPNVEEIGWPAILPLGAAFAMSALFMANRAAAGMASALAMQAWLAIVAAPTLMFVAFFGHLSGEAALVIAAPSVSVVAKCAVVAFTASIAHWLIYLGTTRSGAASVAPMTYVQLVVATTLGWWWFADRPDTVTLIGAAVIIGAGLYLWHSEKRAEAHGKV